MRCLGTSFAAAHLDIVSDDEALFIPELGLDCHCSKILVTSRQISIDCIEFWFLKKREGDIGAGDPFNYPHPPLTAVPATGGRVVEHSAGGVTKRSQIACL